jgi:hypothetical protein
MDSTAGSARAPKTRWWEPSNAESTGLDALVEPAPSVPLHDLARQGQRAEVQPLLSYKSVARLIDSAELGG